MADLYIKIENGTAKLGVIGIGYVGLPLALAFASRFDVIGYDINKEKVNELKAGRSFLSEHQKKLATFVEEGVIKFTDDIEQIESCDVYLICLPTPLDNHMEPNMEYVFGAVSDLHESGFLCPGKLIVLTSTTYPGTTEEIRNMIQLVDMVDYCPPLVYSPEREDPGNEVFGVSNTPRIVAGDNSKDLELGKLLFGKVCEQIHAVESTKTAEFVKLYENTYRAVNIAHVNEAKLFCDAMGIDIWKVLDLAETKPYGFQRFNPGPGWGGHCIPIDPFYLSWKMKEFGIRARFIELAGEINVRMPIHVVRRVQDILNGRQITISQAEILVWGVAYKADVDDVRESPAFPIMKMLRDRGANVGWRDPRVKKLPAKWEMDDMKRHDVISTQGFDAVLVLTDHAEVFELIPELQHCIIDTRGVIPLADNVYRV
jgi:UDP-N-acetyl-D-glucosamine dehydrogenase